MKTNKKFSILFAGVIVFATVLFGVAFSKVSTAFAIDCSAYQYTCAKNTITCSGNRITSYCSDADESFTVDCDWACSPLKCTGTSENCTLNNNTLTVSATAGAGGTISPASQTVNSGSTTTFAVTPNSGYSISSVSGCGGSLSGNTYTTGAITAACTVTASFSTTPPPGNNPTPTGSLSATPSSCNIAEGASSCTTVLTWSTTPTPSQTSAVTSAYPQNDTTVATGNNSPTGGQSVSIPYAASPETFYLYNPSYNLPLAQTTVTATCAPGTSWSTTTNNCIGAMTGTLTQTSPCVVASGGTSCNTTLSWNLYNEETAPAAITESDLSGNNLANIPIAKVVSSPQSGTQTVNVSASSGVTFYLYDNAVKLAQTNILISPSGSWVLSGVCTPNTGASCSGGQEAGTQSYVCDDSVADCTGSAPASQNCTLACGGQCSVPVSHSSPCSTGSTLNGKITESISGWTWYCQDSYGNPSPKCVEYKKKPKVVEN